MSKRHPNENNWAALLESLLFKSNHFLAQDCLILIQSGERSRSFQSREDKLSKIVFNSLQECLLFAVCTIFLPVIGVVELPVEELMQEADRRTPYL